MDQMPETGSQLDDAIHRHIGHIVHTASLLEDTATVLLTFLANADDPQKVRPLVQGRRLSDLAGLLGLMLPEYSDRAVFIKAIVRTNDYRDQLAHSSRDIVPEDRLPGDIGSYSVQWLARQRRKDRDSIRLDVTTLRGIEAEHSLVLAALEVLTTALIMARIDGSEAAPSIREQLAKAARDPALQSIWSDPVAFTAFDRLLAPKNT